jgi:hypothetical protein
MDAVLAVLAGAAGFVKLPRRFRAIDSIAAKPMNCVRLSDFARWPNGACRRGAKDRTDDEGSYR